MDVILSSTPQQVDALAAWGGIRCDAQRFAEHRADLHLALRDCDIITSCCSLWWSQTAELAGERLGVAGHFNSLDGSGAELLEAAARQLRERGCTLAVGPMDGNTWHSYRLVTDQGSEPPFFFEPQNPPEWPVLFEDAGFTPLARYYSALDDDLSREDAGVSELEQRMRDKGIVIRPATAESIESDLEAIYRVSLASFVHNFLYTPLPSGEFLEQYRRVLPFVDPRLVLLAERNGETAGFLFAIPDALQRKRGAVLDTAIVKTLAVLPEASLKGLGRLLVAKAHRAMHELGFRRSIHALMHEGNASLKISRHCAKTMRRYTLFSRSLCG